MSRIAQAALTLVALALLAITVFYGVLRLYA